MANINLLTIHWGMSYGALMQTYATCQLLKEAGHDVRVINLMHPKVRYKYIVPKRWIYLIREFLFWKFKRKNFAPLTSKTFSIKTSKLPNADLTIVGSDQVWNRRITGIFGKTFYLDFVPEHQKRIALSSSFGVSDWNYDETYTREVQLLFDKFDAISVREFSGITILHNVFNKKQDILLHKIESIKLFEGKESEVIEEKIKIIDELEQIRHDRRVNKNELNKILSLDKRIKIHNLSEQFNKIEIPIDKNYEYLSDEKVKQLHIMREYKFRTDKERLSLMRQLKHKYSKLVVDSVNSKIIAYNKSK